MASTTTSKQPTHGTTSVDNDRKNGTETLPPIASITEGSSTMTYPSDQESSVFYNPVQVQNRDLSILMIALYAERRAIRKAVTQKKKELRREQESTVKDNQQRLTKEERKAREEQLLQQVRDYEQTLNGTHIVAQQQATSTVETDQSNDNQDVSSCAANKNDGLTILDALAASGLRSIRYWKEIPGVKHITINDLEAAAVERAHANVQHNGLRDVLLSHGNDNRDHGICIQQGDATHEMYMSRRPQQLRTTTPSTTLSTVGQQQHEQKPMWDVIDLDPYGSAAPFLDGAVQSIESGGLLCVTCTDMAALGGSHPETAYGRYAALPIQSASYLQELALRILLHTIAVSAARYGRTIRPILSVGMAFYVRVFVEVNNDKKGVSDLSLNIGQVYQSTSCPSFVVAPHGQMGGKKKNVYQSSRLSPSCCPETGSHFKVGGPLWLGPLHDVVVVQAALDRLTETRKQLEGSSNKFTKNGVSREQDDTNTEAEGRANYAKKHLDISLLATRDRIVGLLSSVRDELIDGAPLYYTLPTLCKTLRVTSPTLKQVMAAIHNAGYRVSGYHKEPSAIKTDAPSSVIWDVMRAWAKEHPPKKTPPADSAAHKILSVEPRIIVDFKIPTDFLSRTSDSVARFPANPAKFWGPKAKATNKVMPATTGTISSDNSKRNHDAVDPIRAEPDAKKVKGETSQSE